MNSPAGHCGGVDGDQYQVTLVHELSGVLQQLPYVKVSHCNGLGNGKGPPLVVVWPIPDFLVLLQKLKSNTLRDSVVVSSVSSLTMDHEQSANR